MRITCADHVLTSLLLPKLEPLLREYPDIHIEFDICNGLRDIVADRFDAGVRFGEHLDQDMIAVPIGPLDRMAAMATPEYFASHPLPQSPQDLMSHRCLNLRLPTYGGLYAWEFEQDGRELRVQVEGQLIFNSARHIVDAALRGLGIAFLPESEFDDRIACNGCWKTGARPSAATTSITQAGARARRPSAWRWRRCARVSTEWVNMQGGCVFNAGKTSDLVRLSWLL